MNSDAFFIVNFAMVPTKLFSRSRLRQQDWECVGQRKNTILPCGWCVVVLLLKIVWSKSGLLARDSWPQRGVIHNLNMTKSSASGSLFVQRVGLKCVFAVLLDKITTSRIL
jgi:hypothetical protein